MKAKQVKKALASSRPAATVKTAGKTSRRSHTMTDKPLGQGELFPISPRPRPRTTKSADIIRYDTTIVYPKTGREESEHVKRMQAGDKSFWMLSDTGRTLFADAIREVGLYAKNHPDLLELAAQNELVRLPKNSASLGFQIVNLLVAHRDYGFTRTDLEAFNEAFAVHGIQISNDVIQAARHTEQWGCKRIADVKVDGKTVYLLPDQLEYYTLMRKTEMQVADMDRDEAINLIKAHYQAIVDTPNENWDVGHTRPGGDAVFYQPKRPNRSSRDKYYFDPYGHRLIATPKWAVRLMDRHYTLEEMVAVHAELGAFLEEALGNETE